MCSLPLLDPSEFDVVVLGTSLQPCIVSSALSRAGQRVLHLDWNEFYGGNFASCSLGELEARTRWESKRTGDSVGWNWKGKNKVVMEINTPESCYRNFVCERVAADDIVQKFKNFSVDLSPHLLFSRGDMVELLVQSTASKYLEFHAVDNLFLCWKKSFERVPITKSDVFNSSAISMIEKRRMISFVHLIVAAAASKENPVNDHHVMDLVNTKKLHLESSQTLLQLLEEQKMSERCKSIIAYAFALQRFPFDSDFPIPIEESLSIMRLFFQSIGRYSPQSAFLLTLYGMADLPQAFSRLSAVFGGLFILRCLPKSITLSGSEDFEDDEIQAGNEESDLLEMKANFAKNQYLFRAITLPNGQLIRAKHLVCDPDYALQWITTEAITYERTCCVTNKTITRHPLFASSFENAGILIIPPHEFGNEAPIQILQYDASTCVCPEKLFLVYLSTVSNQTSRTSVDLVINTLFCSLAQDYELKPSVDFVDSNHFAETPHDAPALLWKSSWLQVKRTSGGYCPPNVFICDDPPFDVEFSSLVSRAEQIFEAICPGQPFLPSCNDLDSSKSEALNSLSDDDHVVNKSDPVVNMEDEKKRQPIIEVIANLPDAGISSESPAIESPASLTKHILSQPLTNTQLYSLSVAADASSSVAASSLAESPTSMVSHASVIATFQQNQNVNLSYSSIPETAISRSPLLSVSSVSATIFHDFQKFQQSSPSAASNTSRISRI